MKISYCNSIQRWFRHLLTGLVAAIFIALPVHALEPINTTYLGNLAIEGYDTVAYFTENQPVIGRKDFEYEWKGANWRFSSAENLNQFKATPTPTAPIYGGYCAYAVSQNTTASIGPTQFTVHENKLYLNYSKKINVKWLANRDAYIVDANRNWPKLLNN